MRALFQFDEIGCRACGLYVWLRFFAIIAGFHGLAQPLFHLAGTLA